MWYEWHYIVSSPEAIDELQRAAEDVLSFMAVAEEVRPCLAPTNDIPDLTMWHIRTYSSRRPWGQPLPLTRTTSPSSARP